MLFKYLMGLPWWLSGKESTCQCGDMVQYLGWEDSPGGGHGNPLQYSSLENSSQPARGAWQATVRKVTQSWTLLMRFST